MSIIVGVAKAAPKLALGMPDYQYNQSRRKLQFRKRPGIKNKNLTNLFNIGLTDAGVFDSNERISSHIMRKSGAHLHGIYSERKMSPSLLRLFACWHENEGQNDMLDTYIVSKTQQLEADAVDALNPLKSGKHMIIADPTLKKKKRNEMNGFKDQLVAEIKNTMTHFEPNSFIVAVGPPIS